MPHTQQPPVFDWETFFVVLGLNLSLGTFCTKSTRNAAPRPVREEHEPGEDLLLAHPQQSQGVLEDRCIDGPGGHGDPRRNPSKAFEHLLKHFTLFSTYLPHFRLPRGKLHFKKKTRKPDLPKLLFQICVWLASAHATNL